MRTFGITRTGSPRIYLILLHSMFLTLYAVQYLPYPVTHGQGWLIIALATVTLVLLTVPRGQLFNAPCIGFRGSATSRLPCFPIVGDHSARGRRVPA